MALAVTDNRRLPLGRRFTNEELGQPVELHDGAGIAAELYRPKNGSVRETEHYERIRGTFTDLTGRILGLRSYPATPDGQGPAMIVEPTVIDGHGERPIEFSGAGVQEALVLSTLMPTEPGRVVVLDEPAVNLEPTMQRRLISKLRGPGQFLVITHSADLVPVETATDLRRIVRLTPTPHGSQVQRADLGALGAKESLGWLRPSSCARGPLR